MLARALPCLLVLCALAPCASPVLAGGGPRNVLVVLNEASEEALEIGTYYVQARGIPEGNICRITAPTALSISKAQYQDEVETPIEQCLADSPYSDRLDYIVLTRGMPIRASFPGGNVAVAALLQVLATDLRGKDQEYAEPYGFVNYPNPYRNRDEYFSHQKLFGGRNLYVVTMLSGYWSEEAKALVDRSLASDGNPPSAAGGVFYLEETTAAGSPANTRNADCGPAAMALEARGLTAVHVTGPDPNVTDSVVASHVNAGTYSSINRAAIDSNTYPPGALVDVLESFGLTPPNFDPDNGGQQVPVTWWVTAGITGAHGTVSEPYSIAFPDGFMLEPYVDGYNLGETFYQGIPYLYWMNLVLGDPLAAPYAQPPEVTITSPADGANVSGVFTFSAMASTVKPEGIGRMEFFIDDALVHTVAGDMGSTAFPSFTLDEGRHRLEVVAYENTRFFTQATAGVDVFVDNAGLTATITDPPAGTAVSGTFPVTIETSGGVTDVSLRAGGLDLGSVTGSSPFVVDVDTALLGRGINTLRATGLSGMQQVHAEPVDVRVLKSPRLHDLLPIDGPAAGGTDVVIRGWNFEADTRVLFGGTEAPTVTVVDANRLEVVTPPGPPIAVDVRIESGGLALDLPAAYTYIGEPCMDDADLDLVCDDVDNCPLDANVDQANADGDLHGDVCDNCPDTPNDDQLDSDGDMVGDACDGCAVTTPMSVIHVSLDATGTNLHVDWTGLGDSCLVGYVVYSSDSPAGGWGDITDQDLDLRPDNERFSIPVPAGDLVVFDVHSLGSNGELGPP